MSNYPVTATTKIHDIIVVKILKKQIQLRNNFPPSFHSTDKELMNDL